MATLHIEHAITDFGTWKAAFDRFSDARAQAGVRSHRVQQPIDDPHYVLIDLEFATTSEAQAFLAFLRARVWSSSEGSPALVGEPRATILELAESA